MTSLFSSSENNCLEREVDVEGRALKLNDVWTANDLNRCIKFLREGSFSRVCLQFSDEILNYSVEIEHQLKKHIDSDVFLLADTSYGSCCVDEVRILQLRSKICC
jgi:diphthamide biosynthesis protein 2